ncbi:MAG: hypothetical protein IH600_17330 [Bacteroidetes bacterium]|nr:hypothetical protein [Bacteroidota bacterium]
MRYLLLPLILFLCAGAAQAQWKPGDPIVDTRDGQSYRTVVIGSQVWMAENLNIGVSIPSTGAGALMKDNGVIEKYCWGDDKGNCDGTGGVMKRGGFYEWQEAVQYWNGQPALPVRGLCPEGWHLPSNAEWNTLLNYLGGATAYTAMVAGGASGFDALLTGYRCTMSGSYRVSAMSADTRTYFWTAEQTDAANAPFVEVGQNSLQAISFQKSVGLCVRCILDAVTTGSGEIDAPLELHLRSHTVSPQREVTVYYQSDEGPVDILVVDILGRVLLRTTREAVRGENILNIDLSGVAAGTCVFRISRGREVVTQLMQLN